MNKAILRDSSRRLPPEWRNGIRSGFKIRHSQGFESSSLSSGTERSPGPSSTRGIVGRAMRSLRVAAMLSFALLGCSGDALQAVGDPGGAFNSGAGCSVAELESGGPQACPAPPAGRAQLRFDDPADQALISLSANLSDKRVSCRRSWCGPGSLAFQAAIAGRSPGRSRVRSWGSCATGSIPRSICSERPSTHALFVEGPVTPVNAFVAVIEPGGRFWMVQDGPVNLFGRWTQRGPAWTWRTPGWGCPPARPRWWSARSGSRCTWPPTCAAGDQRALAGQVYVDEVGWR